MNNSSSSSGIWIVILLGLLLITGVMLNKRRKNRDTGNSEPEIITINAELIED